MSVDNMVWKLSGLCCSSQYFDMSQSNEGFMPALLNMKLIKKWYQQNDIHVSDNHQKSFTKST